MDLCLFCPCSNSILEINTIFSESSDKEERGHSRNLLMLYQWLNHLHERRIKKIRSTILAPLTQCKYID